MPRCLGAMPGRECGEASWDLQSDVERAGSKGQELIIALLDYHKFFDSFEPRVFAAFLLYQESRGFVFRGAKAATCLDDLLAGGTGSQNIGIYVRLIQALHHTINALSKPDNGSDQSKTFQKCQVLVQPLVIDLDIQFIHPLV